jgi:DNA-directed RNA polymerase subunit RPC12/RpoP
MASGPSIKCPCCAHALYRVISEAPGVVGFSGDSPKVQSDEKGHFMKCPHCQKRIVFVTVSAIPGGAGFALAPQQPCNEV